MTFKLNTSIIIDGGQPLFAKTATAKRSRALRYTVPSSPAAASAFSITKNEKKQQIIGQRNVLTTHFVNQTNHTVKRKIIYCLSLPSNPYSLA
jgi:hypothetical protein